MSGRPESEVKRMKSVTLDRKLSSTARLPQRSMVVESPAGRMADGNGQIISARGAESPTPTPKERQTEIIITSEDASNNATTVNVLRPPFARNNTSVKIIKENSEESPQRGFRRVSAPKEDDAITLGDISLLADKDRRPDNRPLLSNLSPLQSIILRHFALLQLQKTSLGPLIDLDDMLDLLDARKGQWWNKIFKGNAKKDTKKKGELSHAVINGRLLIVNYDRSVRCSHRGFGRADWFRFFFRRSQFPSQSTRIYRRHHIDHEANG